jgi:hypothetical protein
MKRNLLFFVTLLSLFVCCNTQKNRVAQLKDNEVVDKIELLVSSDNKIIANSIKREHWSTVSNVIKAAEYDSEQYDEVKNPDGYNGKGKSAGLYVENISCK